jgi:hypothetical protein
MAERKSSGSGIKPALASREDRLKSALKANLARRKAQARARAVDEAKKTGKNKG